MKGQGQAGRVQRLTWSVLEEGRVGWLGWTQGSLRWASYEKLLKRRSTDAEGIFV